LGIGGVVTFKNGGLDKFLADIPLERIVLETDSPYLAPVPHRGKRNEVSYLDLVIDKIADIYKISADEVKSQTTLNAKKLIEI
jgi:TatD DNase family protein